MMESTAYTHEPMEVAAALAVDPERGLASGEAVRRSIHFGRNVIHDGQWPILGAIASLFLPAHPRHACVLCEGAERVVNACDLVPGDVIVVDSGDDIPADARVITASQLAVDEQRLTGTRVPVMKSPRAVSEAPAPRERFSMLYRGTHVVAGHATAIVTATGDATELAKKRRATHEEEPSASGRGLHV
jgi:magnesium-transporting ATPase (P-type)